MTKMYRTDFDPYDALIEMNQRLARVEQAHNTMADDFVACQRQIRLLEETVINLQKSHLQLTELVRQTTELVLKTT